MNKPFRTGGYTRDDPNDGLPYPALTHVQTKVIHAGPQSRGMSVVEAVANTAFGLVIAFVAQSVLFYAYGIEVTHAQNAWVVFWMTIVSVVRSYVLRRLFNR